MKDKVIKAYMASFDGNLRIPYIEKKTSIDDLTIIASVYKNVVSKKFYCLAVIVNSGEYLFDEGINYSRYYDGDEIVAKDVAQETITAIKQQIVFRKRMLTHVSNNPNLPSVLSAAFNKTLLLYYVLEGKLAITRLDNDELVINLPASEQVYLRDLLQGFGIHVRRTPEELPYRHGLN